MGYNLPPNPLAVRGDVAPMPSCSSANNVPVRPMPHIHFVRDVKATMRVAYLADAFEISGRGGLGTRKRGAIALHKGHHGSGPRGARISGVQQVGHAQGEIALGSPSFRMR